MAREHVFARETASTRYFNGRAVYTARTWLCMGRAHGPSTPPVYMAVYGPSVRTSSAVYMARTRPRTRDVYTAMYGPCTRPCTRHVYGRVHVSTCTRAVYTAVYGPSTRPKTAVYTAVHGRVTCRVYGHVWAVSARVYGSVRAVCTYVFGRVHWPCILPFSAVYIARTRPCNGPCTRPLHGHVQGPCIRQVGLPGRVHVPRRHATAVCGPLRHTVRVRYRVHGPCRRTCTWLCMGRVYDRVHGALRPYTRPTAVTCRLGPCTRPCTPTCHVHDCVLAVYKDVYIAHTRPFNCGVDVCTCRTAV